MKIPRPTRSLALRIRAAVAALRGKPTGVITRPTVGDFTPFMWAGRRLTPDQIRLILIGAIGGNLAQQWSLFDIMEDTWPRLMKNLAELRNSAKRISYAVQPYAARGEDATDTARARADLVHEALHNWRPKPGTLEVGLEDALFDALDCYGKGLSVLEVEWQQLDEGMLPRCAHLLPVHAYGWNSDGTELGLVSGDSGSQLSALNSQQTWSPFPPGQFWVGVWKGRSGPPGQTALLRCLAPYWCGITFGWEWLLNNAQIFGVPFRWATYDRQQPELLPQIEAMLQALGSSGWAAFPDGTTLDFKEAVQRAADNPQVFVQDLADKYCDQLILGQDASSQMQSAGLGAGSGRLHGAVRSDRLQEVTQWCADLLNYQLVPAILRLNFGDESEPPTIVPETAGETDPLVKAQRDQTLAAMGLQLPTKFLYDRHGIPEPEDGEDTIGGAPAADPLSLPPPGGTSEMPAPGSPSDAGAPETGDPEMGEMADSEAVQPPGGGQTTSARAKSRLVNPPRSAVGSRGALPPGAKALPGDYPLPPATARALAAALARDFAPLRKAAEPLLASIQAGNLAVVGEIEAFIARLDHLAPQMVGASQVADALEAALAEAAIAGAAGAYSKLPPAKP